MKHLDVQLAAICGPGWQTERFGRMYSAPECYTDYKELLEDIKPEMVIVYPDDESLQPEITRACLLAGADVLCERPVYHTLEEGGELAALQRQTGRFVMPRYNRRYMPAYASAKAIVDSAQFGRPYMYSACFHAGEYASERIFRANHISHHLDLARMLLGEITLLHVDKTVENDHRVGYNIVFKSLKDTLGNIQSNSFLCMDYPMERVEICGDRHQVIVENVRTVKYNRPVVRIGDTSAEDFLAEGGTRVLNMNCAQLNNFTYYGFEEMVREFFRCSAAGIKPAQDMEDALETFKLIKALEKLS